MKRIILLILLLGSVSSSFQALAQRNDQRMMRRRDKERKEHRGGKGSCPRAYIGFSTGINNPVGYLGPQVDIALSPIVSIGTGVGLSTWGTKAFAEFRYYFRPCNRGWAIGTGFTYNTGYTGLTLNDVETQNYGKRDVIIDQHAQTNFMLTAYHFFSLGHSGRNRFHLQFGFSVPLSEKQYISNYTLSSDGDKVIKALAPGGLVLGIGFSFGAGRM